METVKIHSVSLSISLCQQKKRTEKSLDILFLYVNLNIFG